MVKYIIKEMVKFFVTFGIVAFSFWIFVSFLAEYLISDVTRRTMYKILVQMINVMKGRVNFQRYSLPEGKIFIISFLTIFKIMLMSLLVPMYTNKYRREMDSLVAMKRY